MSAAEILQTYKRNEAFYRGGGITVSGGEPLGQLKFVTELFAAAKQAGIHTCLDTSGILTSYIFELAQNRFDQNFDCAASWQN